MDCSSSTSLRLACRVCPLALFHVVGTHVAPAFGLHWLRIVVQIGVRLAQDVPNGVHVAVAYAVAQVGDVRSDPVGVLVATIARDGLGYELLSDHAGTSHSASVLLSLSAIWL